MGDSRGVQYIPRNMHTDFALLCFVVVIHWLIFPYPSGLLHWHCGNLTIAPVPAKQPWWIWINISCEFIMNDCITTTKQSTTKPCAYLLGYTVYVKISDCVIQGPQFTWCHNSSWQVKPVISSSFPQLTKRGERICLVSTHIFVLKRTRNTSPPSCDGYKRCGSFITSELQQTSHSSSAGEVFCAFCELIFFVAV